jgi:DNA replication protein DnaC
MAGSDPKKITSLFGNRFETEQRLCESHGEYTATCFKIAGRDQWSNCPGCDRVKQDEENKELATRLYQEKLESMHRDMLGRASIPERFKDRTLETYSVENDGQRKALDSCKRYVDNWDQNRSAGTSLIMCGHPGTGKTHLAIGIAREIMKKGKIALFARVIELARTVKETYQRDADRTERQVLADFARPDLLILDEVGVQHGSDTERMILFEVINARYEQCKPTILITNLSLAGLREYLDPRAEDRLREGGGRVIVFDWESHRGKV